MTERAVVVRVEVELVGGPFDGMPAILDGDDIKRGFVMVFRCPRHGDNNSDCDCGDEMWHGYFIAWWLGRGSGWIRPTRVLWSDGMEYELAPGAKRLHYEGDDDEC